MGGVGAPGEGDEAGLPCYKHSSQADTVSEQGEDDEVDGGPHARANASLRADAVVHHLVPVLACQDLHESKPAGLVTGHPRHPDTLLSPGHPPPTPPAHRAALREKLWGFAEDLGLLGRVWKLLHLGSVNNNGEERQVLSFVVGKGARELCPSSWTRLVSKTPSSSEQMAPRPSGGVPLQPGSYLEHRHDGCGESVEVG